MVREARERYACAPTSPAHARRFCTDRLAEMLAGRAGAEVLIADAEMVVSELVTNAVNARTTSAELLIRADGGRVRIEVGDDAGGVPTQRSPSPDAGSGRGLMIVAALSMDWGVASGPWGKRVWAEFELAPERHRVHAY